MNCLKLAMSIPIFTEQLKFPIVWQTSILALAQTGRKEEIMLAFASLQLELKSISRGRKSKTARLEAWHIKAVIPDRQSFEAIKKALADIPVINVVL